MTQTPFDFWLNAFRAPLSGDVTQDIDPRYFSPNVTFEFAGDRRVEGRIVSRVASYGRQLDTLIGAVQALASATGNDVPELDEMAARISAEKAASREDLARTARQALAALRDVDPAMFHAVLDEAQPAQTSLCPVRTASTRHRPARVDRGSRELFAASRQHREPRLS